MEAFVTGITTLVSGIFQALIDALASLGTLIFKTAEDTGAVSGLTPFGYLAILFVAIPLATWVFNKAMGFINKLRAK